MSGRWTYREYSDNVDSSSSQTVISKLDSFLGGLRPAVAATAKMGLTDQAKGPSYGVIFYNEDALESPVGYPQGGWERVLIVMKHNSDYTPSYERIRKILNGEGTDGDPKLSEPQANYAHLLSCDKNGGPGVIALFYPKA